MTGLVRMDIAGMPGSLLNGGARPEPMTAPWLAGVALHFLNGSLIFPPVYAALLYLLLAGLQAARLPEPGQGRTVRPVRDRPSCL